MSSFVSSTLPCGYQELRSGLRRLFQRASVTRTDCNKRDRGTSVRTVAMERGRGQGELVSDPQHPHKEANMTVCACNLSASEVETGASLELSDRPA